MPTSITPGDLQSPSIASLTPQMSTNSEISQPEVEKTQKESEKSNKPYKIIGFFNPTFTKQSTENNTNSELVMDSIDANEIDVGKIFSSDKNAEKDKKQKKSSKKKCTFLGNKLK